MARRDSYDPHVLVVLDMKPARWPAQWEIASVRGITPKMAERYRGVRRHFVRDLKRIMRTPEAKN